MKEIKLAAIGLIALISFSGYSQNTIDLTSTDAFEVGKNWKIVGDVNASLEEDGVLNTVKGKGILVNIPSDKHHSNLLTKQSYGDLDIEVDLMMARHSNSGIYLMGRYEVQLLDSWGKKDPNYGDLGGIYQRRRPDGSQYEGHAPFINASKAPGTWQHIEISFRAPRFDANGKKTENAKILSVDLNGYRVQENIELTGPTGGPISEEEAPTGPIMIQGDHGPVAFRNLVIREFSDPEIVVKDVEVRVYEGEIPELQSFNWTGLKSTTINLEAIDVTPFTEEVGWAAVFKGKIVLPEAGDYQFGMQAGGESMMMVDGKVVVPKGWMRPTWPSRMGDTISLTAGEHDLELIYAKVDGWLPTGLGVYILGEKIRPKALHQGLDPSILLSVQPSTILDANVPRVMRSFTSVPEGEESKVLTHIVNVGSPNGLHYSFDTSTGSLVKLWRGQYLDMSPMWNGRGNAQSRALGIELFLDLEGSKPAPDHRGLGYDLKSDGFPIFRYEANGIEIMDEISESGGKTVTRNISGESLVGLEWTVTSAMSIDKISDDLYSINDKEYFIRTNGEVSLEPNGEIVRMTIKSLGKELSYTIIW